MPLTLVRGPGPDVAEPEYAAVTAADIRTIAIFPPIGIARVGDSDTNYFIGPELPMSNDIWGSLPPTHDGKFRDTTDDHNIRRQAARFRVYAFGEDNEPLGEINKKNGFTLKWTVHVKNKKAAKTGRNSVTHDSDASVTGPLIVDAGAQDITSDQQDETVELNQGKFKDVTVNLGQLKVDAAGHLLFIPAKGQSQSVPAHQRLIDQKDNDKWVDDMCDGTVDVEIPEVAAAMTEEKLELVKHIAAVVSAPPKFAWGIHSFTSLFDIIEDAYHTGAVAEPDFNTHIYPVLLSTSSLAWVNKKARTGHGGSKQGNFVEDIPTLKSKETSDKERKEDIFARLRKPGGGGGNMPVLSGAGNSLTTLQYARFTKWKDHEFGNNTEPVRYKRIEDVPRNEQPMYLTRASLEPTIGGSFAPGIEVCEIMMKPGATTGQIYDKTATLTPGFRLNYREDKLGPGDLTMGLPVPWQADFDACGEAWWPAARPTQVTRSGNRRDWTPWPFPDISNGTFKKMVEAASKKGEVSRKAKKQTVDETRMQANAYDKMREASFKKMLANWHRLGFVAKPAPTTEEIEAETTEAAAATIEGEATRLGIAEAEVSKAKAAREKKNHVEIERGEFVNI